MASSSMDELKDLSETDLFSPTSKSLSLKSDHSSFHEDHYSWRYLAKTYFNNSKQLKTSVSNVFIKENTSINHFKNLPGAISITMNEMLKAQNTNAPWLFNIFRKKFRRSRKHKNDHLLIKDVDSNNTMTLAEGLLEKATTNDGISGKWIVKEKDAFCPLIENFDAYASGQYNVSRAVSSSTSPSPISTDDSLHLRHYHYDFQTVDTQLISSPSFQDNHQSQCSPITTDDIKQEVSNKEYTPPMVSMIKTLHTSNQQEIKVHRNRKRNIPFGSSTLSSREKLSIDDVYLVNANSAIQTKSKRAKSASATRSNRAVSSTSKTKDRGQSISTRKKKSKYYQEHILSREEIELREALRIIDLDNIGFFPPSELRKALKDIGINTNDIEKIERCLPLDDDGHYSIDNLVKLLLATK